jgi:hypothetical protein
MKKSSLWCRILLALLLSGLPASAYAQTAEDCTRLMQYGIYDRYRTFTTANEFRLIQSFFKEYQFSSRQEAETKAGVLGLNIADILSLNLNGQTSSSSFQQWVQSFLNESYDQLVASTSLSQTVDVISGKITDLVGLCITRSGLHAYLVPAQDNLNFTFTLAFVPLGSDHPSTAGQFDIQPSTVASSCTPANIVGQVGLLIGPQGISVACRRTATETVTIVSNTADGNASVRYDAYVIPQPIISFTANPTVIDVGGSATLQWNVQNADSVQLNPGFGLMQPTGTMTVSPLTTQQYDLIIKSLDGKTTNSYATVTVNPPPLTLTSATVSFHTNDDDRDHDTNESIYISCPGLGTVAFLNGTFGDQGFPDNSDRGPFTFNVTSHPRLDQVSSCQLHIDQNPNGNDTWRYNVSLHLVFSNGQSSQPKDYSWGQQELHNNASNTHPL